MEDDKTSEAKVEHLNLSIDPLHDDAATATVVVENQVYQGINCHSILAFLVR
jgi:hypothetical protein